MLPGFRDPAKRLQSYEPPSQLIHDKKNTSMNAPMQVKNENHINFRFPEEILVRLRDCREYINALKAENTRLDEENALRAENKRLDEENASKAESKRLDEENALKAENKRLNEENALLRKGFEELSRKKRQQNCENAQKLIDAKSHIWCMKCSNQIDKSQRLCYKCEDHKQHSSYRTKK